MTPSKPSENQINRRDFIKTSAAVTAAGALTSPLSRVLAAGSDRLRVGVIGCGARGTGAAMNCVLSSPGVDIVALAELDLTPVMFREGYRLGPAPGVTVPPGYGQELV